MLSHSAHASGFAYTVNISSTHSLDQAYSIDCEYYVLLIIEYKLNVFLICVSVYPIASSNICGGFNESNPFRSETNLQERVPLGSFYIRRPPRQNRVCSKCTCILHKGLRCGWITFYIYCFDQSFVISQLT